MPNLVVATQNAGKLAEMQKYLADWPGELLLMPADVDIEETGDTFLANATLKASQVAQITGEWAIADDSGLEVDALGGAPGIYSARYGRTDAERIQRLLQELGEGCDDRKARFRCVVALARPDGSIACHAEGYCPGEILRVPRGSNGFGYDPIFYVPATQQTFAEMTTAAKKSMSHRGDAFKALLPKLKGIQGELI